MKQRVSSGRDQEAGLFHVKHHPSLAVIARGVSLAGVLSLQVSCLLDCFAPLAMMAEISMLYREFHAPSPLR